MTTIIMLQVAVQWSLLDLPMASNHCELYKMIPTNTRHNNTQSVAKNQNGKNNHTNKPHKAPLQKSVRSTFDRRIHRRHQRRNQQPQASQFINSKLAYSSIDYYTRGYHNFDWMNYTYYLILLEYNFFKFSTRNRKSCIVFFSSICGYSTWSTEETAGSFRKL